MATFTQELSFGPFVSGILLDGSVSYRTIQILNESALYSFTSGSLPAQATFTRASTGTYLNSSGLLVTAGVDVARFDYLINGVYAPGTSSILLEPAATNVVLQSQTFDNASWVKGALTVTANAAAAPDGTTTMDKLAENNTSASHIIYQLGSSGTAVTTVSVWMKAAERNFGWLQIATDGAAKRFTVVVNLTTGAVTATTSNGSPVSPTYGVEDWGNGLFRVWVKATNGGGSVYLLGGPSNSGTPTYDANSQVTYAGTTGNGIYWWGAQIEQGSLTSYIPTVAASASRSADALRIVMASRLATVQALFDNSATQSISTVQTQSNLIPTNLTRARVSSFTSTLFRAPSSLYNPSALASWRTAITNRDSVPATALVMGDSITEGYNSTTYGTRWVDQLATNLRTLYPTSAASVGGSTYRPGKYTFTDASWVTATHGAGGTLSLGTIGGHRTDLASVGDGYTYTTGTCTSFDLHYYSQPGNGVLNVEIDGGAAQAIDTNVAAAHRVWNSGALSASVHTIKVTKASGGTCYLSGFALYNGDEAKGIRIIDAGRAAAKAYETGCFRSGEMAQAALFSPALGIIALTVNDYNAQTALATYKANLTSQISDFRTACGSTVPILIVFYNEPGNLAAQPIPYTSYVTAARELADTLSSVAVLDCAGGWPASAKTPTTPADPVPVWDTDYLHFTAAGHTYMGQLLLDGVI